jgi:hypothetical protein
MRRLRSIENKYESYFIMDLQDYIDELKRIKPSEELLLNAGFKTIPTDIIKNYVLDRKESGNSIVDDLMFDLFSNYDPQYLRFADYSFYKEIKQINGSFIFAGSSYSELGFTTKEGEVIEYDRDEWSILNYCAKNTESFLEALLPIFEMYSFRFQNIIDTEDTQINNEYIDKCTTTAKGNKYKRFYKGIIG